MLGPSPTLQLNDSTAAAQLGKTFPRPLIFNDRLGAAQVMRLAEPLQTPVGLDDLTGCNRNCPVILRDSRFTTAGAEPTGG